MVQEKQVSEKASEEYLKLISYTSDLPEGIILLYEKVETDTGVKMDAKGRRLLYKAIKYNNRVCINLRNDGYELDSLDRWHVPVSDKLHRMDNAHKSLQTTTSVIKRRYHQRMDDTNREVLSRVEAINNRCLLSSEEKKMFYQNEPVKISETKPIIH